MQAIVYRDFGPPEVLHCEAAEIPAAAPNEVLVRVRAASVNPLDWRLMEGGPLLLRLITGRHRAKHPGVDVAGIVESVGSRVVDFRPGDQVFGLCHGAFAEFASAPASALAFKPADISFEEAAAVPVAALTALQGLRDKGHIERDQQVLINGAAGGVGTFAVQLAKFCGAQVTAVCSAHSFDLVRSLGADYLFDYNQTDFASSPWCYDMILDCVGNHSFAECRRVLHPGGVYVAVGAPRRNLSRWFAGIVWSFFLAAFVSQRFVTFVARRKRSDLKLLARLLSSGHIRSVIDRCYPFAAAAEAVRYVETGHAHGKVVISISEAEATQPGAA